VPKEKQQWPYRSRGRQGGVHLRGRQYLSIWSRGRQGEVHLRGRQSIWSSGRQGEVHLGVRPSIWSSGRRGDVHRRSSRFHFALSNCDCESRLEKDATCNCCFCRAKSTSVLKVSNNTDCAWPVATDCACAPWLSAIRLASGHWLRLRALAAWNALASPGCMECAGAPLAAGMRLAAGCLELATYRVRNLIGTFEFRTSGISVKKTFTANEKRTILRFIPPSFLR
jgi:hypothetical protein